MTFRELQSHPQFDEIFDTICNFEPGRVLVSVGDLKVRDSSKLLQGRIRERFGVNVKRSLIVWTRMQYGGRRRDVDKVAEQRVQNLLL